MIENVIIILVVDIKQPTDIFVRRKLKKNCLSLWKIAFQLEFIRLNYI